MYGYKFESEERQLREILGFGCGMTDLSVN